MGSARISMASTRGGPRCIVVPTPTCPLPKPQAWLWPSGPRAVGEIRDTAVFRYGPRGMAHRELLSGLNFWCFGTKSDPRVRDESGRQDGDVLEKTAPFRSAFLGNV